MHRKHLFLPDFQVTPTTPTDHLSWIAQYILDKKPDVIVSAGDWADMESLSSYDYGKKSHEGKRYINDIHAANKSIKRLTKPLDDYNSKQRKDKHKQYKPRKIVTIGNHEHRISRAVESDAKMEGAIGLHDLHFEKYGWEVIPFLEMVEVDGVTYSHYFANQMSGKPIGGLSIDTRLKNIGISFVQGHQQIYMSGIRSLNNGRRIRGLVCGSCYLHDEDYRGAQANSEWRGIQMLHEVSDGDYSLLEVSLDYLCRQYEGMKLWQFMKKKYRGIFDESVWLQRQSGL
jgi:hypothetical protein